MQALSQSRNSNNGAELGMKRVLREHGTSSAAAVHPEPPRRVSYPSKEKVILASSSSSMNDDCSGNGAHIPLHQQKDLLLHLELYFYQRDLSHYQKYLHHLSHHSLKMMVFQTLNSDLKFDLRQNLVN